MKALIYKDFVALKKALALLAVLVLAIGLYSIFKGNITIIPMIFILIPLIILGMLFGNDAESNADQYIAAGPVKKEAIALSRYVLVWALAVIGTALAGIIKLLPDSYNMPWYILLPAMLFITTIISDIQLPLMYKFGAEKSRIVFFLLYFLVFAIFSYLGSDESFLAKWHTALSDNNLKLAGCILFAATVLFNWLSFAISVKINKNKEF